MGFYGNGMRILRVVPIFSNNCVTIYNTANGVPYSVGDVSETEVVVSLVVGHYFVD